MEIATQDGLTPEAIRDLLGQELGVSDWLTIDQKRIDDFADVTEDHQFIHVDPERAAQTPFGGTIAHGLLTLSMIVHLCFDFVPLIKGRQMLLNYGFDRVRFPRPVKCGSRIRARIRLAKFEARLPNQYLMTLDVEIEIEGQDKPALIAEWLSYHTVEDSDAH